MNIVSLTETDTYVKFKYKTTLNKFDSTLINLPVNVKYLTSC